MSIKTSLINCSQETDKMLWEAAVFTGNILVEGRLLNQKLFQEGAETFTKDIFKHALTHTA